MPKSSRSILICAEFFLTRKPRTKTAPSHSEVSECGDEWSHYELILMSEAVARSGIQGNPGLSEAVSGEEVILVFLPFFFQFFGRKLSSLIRDRVLMMGKRNIAAQEKEKTE